MLSIEYLHLLFIFVFLLFLTDVRGYVPTQYRISRKCAWMCVHKHLMLGVGNLSYGTTVSYLNFVFILDVPNKLARYSKRTK